MWATSSEGIVNFAALPMLAGNRAKFCSWLIVLRKALFAGAPLYRQSELIAMSQVCEVQPKDGPP
jgi:hypothetical protein